MNPKHDSINHPKHYTAYRAECIDIIEDSGWGLHYCLGAAMKYLWRCGNKGAFLEDLKKAHWYITRAIAIAEKAENGQPKP